MSPGDWKSANRDRISTEVESRDRKVLLIAQLVGLAVVALSLTRSAWISDDALITLRSALNLTHGWGAGYNIAESVQAFTHPMWFLLWTGIGSLTGEWIVSIILVGILLSMITAALLLSRCRTIAAVVLVAAVLAFSNAFVEYGTSGLENSLGALLACVLVLLTARASVVSPNVLLATVIGLTCAAIVLTRMDFALLILFPVLLIVWRLRRAPRPLLALLAAALAPVVIWFLWSYSTFAAWLPNTLEAKSNVDIPRLELVIQGLRYLAVSAIQDPITLAAFFIATVVSFIFGSRLQWSWVVGVYSYLGYVVWIGGDFMVGRFLAVPLVVLVASAVLATQGKVGEPLSRQRTLAALAATGGVLLYSYLAGSIPTGISPGSTPKWDIDEKAGIADERGWYMQYGRGLDQWLMSLGPQPDPFSFRQVEDVNPMASMAELRNAASNWPRRNEGETKSPNAVGETCWLGAAGISTGPRVHWIDICGLSDRFLASRTYASKDFQWRIGHFDRPVPDGYPEAVLTGDVTLVRDPEIQKELAELWRKIRR